MVFEQRSVAPGTTAYADVAALYEAAFPAEERLDPRLLDAVAEQTGVDYVAYYDESGAFCGYTYSVDTSAYLYLLFFAVASGLRSRGIGTRILEQLKARFPGRTIVLEIEPLDEHAANCEQRARRFAFYQRNGFAPTGYYSVEDDMVYTVLGTSAAFDAGSFARGVSDATGGQLRPDLRKA